MGDAAEPTAGRTTVVSSPGKVMIAGGYVVLERPNVASVAAVSARVYVVAEDQVLSSPDGGCKIFVDSTQMKETRSYKLAQTGGLLQIFREDGMPTNPYIEAAVLNSLALVEPSKRTNSSLKLSIYGDNAFYATPDGESRGSQARFAKITKAKDNASDHSAEVQKTGLGSSAALVTSLVAAVLAHYQVVTLPTFVEVGGDEEGNNAGSERVKEQNPALSMLHNLSQYCHCLAQGKIGSGFDVASATYGCIKYVRFSNTLLEGISHKPEADIAKLRALVTGEEVTGGSVAGSFDHVAEPWTLPPRLTLMVGDVRGGGSSTTSMVRAVTSWRSEQPDQARPVWEGLCAAGNDIAVLVKQLNSAAAASPASYDAAFAHWSSKGAGAEGEQEEQEEVKHVLGLLDRMRECFVGVRKGMRAMGEAARVPIEPPPQERLLDSTCALPCVLGAGVPGAGGYDAVFAVVKDTAEGRRSVEEAWREWKEGGTHVDVLPIHSSLQGVVCHTALPV